jgi:ribonuclease D
LDYDSLPDSGAKSRYGGRSRDKEQVNDSGKKTELLRVASQQQVEETCAEIRAAGRFGFDTEFVMEDRYEAEVCLIQLASPGRIIIVDPFLDLDLGPVWALVSDAAVETVVHAGAEDLGQCVQHTGAVPRRVFDVQVAAGLVGMDYPISLQKLVRSVLNVHLRKSRTLTDWRKRPLTDAQLRYAMKDVQYLLLLGDELRQRLERRKRMSWAEEEFRKFELMSLYRRADEEKLLRVKGTGALDGRQLAIAEALLNWREEVAQKANRPARTVLRDHLLVEIARHGFQRPEEVRELRGMNLSRRHIKELCDVVARGKALPSREWPKSDRGGQSERPEETLLVSLASAVIRGYCLEHHIAYGLAANKKAITALVRHYTRGHNRKEPAELLNGWRGQTVGAAVDEVFRGRRGVQVIADREKYRLRLVPEHYRGS